MGPRRRRMAASLPRWACKVRCSGGPRWMSPAGASANRRAATRRTRQRCRSIALRPRLNWSSVCSVNGLQCHTTANAHIGALSVSGALSQPSISDLAKENPGTTARWKMPGLIPSPHLQANAAGTRLARQSASRPCRCTTSDRDDAMRSNTPGGTYGCKAGPDAPLVCSTSGEYTRAA